MTDQTPRRRFLTYILLIIAVAAVVFALARVINTASDHDRPPPVKTATTS